MNISAVNARTKKQNSNCYLEFGNQHGNGWNIMSKMHAGMFGVTACNPGSGACNESSGTTGKKASVSVEAEVIGAIGPGLVVLLGVEAGDEQTDVRYLADKVVQLRDFRR